MSKMKQTYVCLAGVFGITCLFTCVAVLCSCSDLTPVQKGSIKEGFVDACYTVLEYNPKDGDARILKYLNSRVSAKELTKEEADMMLRCLKRTSNSSHWRKEKE